MTQFVVVEVGKEREPLLTCSSGKDAGDAARVYNEEARAKGEERRFRVLRVSANVDTMPDWYDREWGRFERGEYKHVPWHTEAWAKCDHFVHVSLSDPSKLAYTVDADRGARDIQTQMRPGRYLSQYHPELGQDAIRQWCARFSIENEEPELKFADTPDDIEAVYTHGPSSCMAYDARDYRSSIHPTRVYGAGDLAIAYLGDPDTYEGATARALCWPERQIFGRIYGDGWRLRDLLVAEGYRQGATSDWQGARLLCLEVENGVYVAPYLDNPCHSVSLDGKYLRIDDCGEISCRETNGLSEGARCDHCGDALCEWCARDYSCCFHCDEQHETDDMSVDLNGEHWCDGCASRHLVITPCGELAQDADDCDCATCERDREAREEEEANGDDSQRPFRPVILKPTSPTVWDHRQLQFQFDYHHHYDALRA